MTEKYLRTYIRKVLSENVNNYLDKEEETETEILADASDPTLLGDPLDVKLNKRANELGSDGKNAPTVAVQAGKEKGGDDFHTGQHQANFSDKTTQA